jgi:hypothetical protein
MYETDPDPKVAMSVTSRGQWQPLIAILANPATREVAAELMLGGSLESATTGMSPSRRRHVTESLVQASLIDARSHAFTPEVFRALLDSAAAPRRRGIGRYLDGDMITQYPANLAERGELLAWVANRAFGPEEVLTEREVNERLLAHSPDVAVLRRYLVDFQLVERRSDGTEYALTGSAPVVTAG